MKKCLFGFLLAVTLPALVGCPSKPQPAENGPPPATAARQLKNVRAAAVAGLFYPGNEKDLKRQIDQFLAEAKGEPVRNLRALVCPHAGYEFSGPVAAVGYKQLVGRHFLDRDPARPQPLRGVRGGVRIALRRLPDAAGNRSGLADRGGDGEDEPLLGPSAVPGGSPGLVPGRPSSRRRWARIRPRPGNIRLEVEVPFLQSTLRDFSIVPVVFGEVDPAEGCGETRPAGGRSDVGPRQHRSEPLPPV